MEDRVGQQFGNYRLERLLGEGGFAEVYLGEHLYLKTKAAIKVLHTRLGQDEMEGFLAEARTIAALKHPHIVRVLDFGVEGRTPYLVMDYAPGGTLRARFPKGAQIPLATTLPLIKQVADALQYAHEQRLIHRDVKPENMLLDERGQVVLSDFGIATIAQSSHYQQTAGVAGTAAYMAPEQLQGKPRPASDQYSLGIVVYEWLTGSRPFQGSFSEIASQHVLTPPPPLRDKVPTISPAVEQVVLTALAKDPKERFASVQAFATAFEQASLLDQPTRISNAPLPTIPRPAAPSGQVQPSSQPAPSLQNASTWVEPQQPAQPSWRASGEPTQRHPPDQAVPTPTFDGSNFGPAVSPLPMREPSKPKRRWVRGLLVRLLMVVLVSGGLLGLKLAGKGPFASLGKPPLGTIKEFAVPTAGSLPYGICVGPDGNLWFTEYEGDQIGRITPEGSITEFFIPRATSGPTGITRGPDGSLWFTEHDDGNRIGRITPSGQITEFFVRTNESGPSDITTGPDGNLWFTEDNGNQIGRITPSGQVTEFAVPTSNSDLRVITAGPDGNLWFTENGSNKIGRITPVGAITEFPLPTPDSGPAGITKGPDGNLWFTERNGNKIGRITPGGSVIEFPVPTAQSSPWDIIAGSDGNLWFTEEESNQIGRITPAGKITEFDVPTTGSGPWGITAGPDGNLWFTEPGGNKIGWISPGV